MVNRSHQLFKWVHGPVASSLFLLGSNQMDVSLGEVSQRQLGRDMTDHPLSPEEL